MQFKHELEEEATYQIELPNGQRYEIVPDDMSEQHKVNAGMGYHGYKNPGGSIVDECPTQEQDSIDANPMTREENEDE